MPHTLLYIILYTVTWSMPCHVVYLVRGVICSDAALCNDAQNIKRIRQLTPFLASTVMAIDFVASYLLHGYGKRG